MNQSRMNEVRRHVLILEYTHSSTNQMESMTSAVIEVHRSVKPTSPPTLPSLRLLVAFAVF